MEKLVRLRAQIASLDELRDLIRAMRALAASHVQEAQGGLAGIRRYVAVIEDAIAEAAALLPAADVESVAAGAGQRALIVVASEHGFVGDFNDHLLDRAAAETAPGVAVGVIGRHGAALARERGLEVAWQVPMATHTGGVPGVTRQAAAHLAAATEARVVHGLYRQGGTFEAVTRTILPLSPEILARRETAGRPLHQLDAGLLLRQLAGEYLFAEITGAVMESLASENGMRLRVMNAADQRIGGKLEAFRGREHTLRQEAITSELIDAVVGAEAVSGR